MSQIESMIAEFEKSKQIAPIVVERLSTSGDLYETFVDFVKHNSHKVFSRALLKTAISLRRNEEFGVMSDDLLAFSWFVSKNGQLEDLELVVSAKVVDFDAWCGFDGEMVYMVLDYEQTQDYLRNNGDKHPEAELDHLLGFSKEKIEKYMKDWRPPFT